VVQVEIHRAGNPDSVCGKLRGMTGKRKFPIISIAQAKKNVSKARAEKANFDITTVEQAKGVGYKIGAAKRNKRKKSHEETGTSHRLHAR
jgi:hypothetical protein